MNLFDYFWFDMDEGGDGGAPAVPTADPAPPGAAAGGTPAPAAPVVPSAPSDPIQDAAAKFQADADKLKPEDKPDEEEEKAEEEKAAEEKAEEEKTDEEKAAEEEVVVEEVVEEPTPEEQEEIAEALEGLDQQEKALQLNELWSSNITPETAAWFDGARKDRVQKRAESEAASKIASGKGLTDAEKKELAELTSNIVPLEFNSKDNWRSITDMESTQTFAPEYLTADKLKSQHGIDPTQVPAKFAPLINDLISAHNKLVANSSFIFAEGKKAFASRDAAKDQLVKNEYEAAITAAGYVADDTTKMLVSEAKQLLHVNGKRQPWAKVIGKLVEKHGKMFTAATPSDTAAAAATAESAAAAKPKEQKAPVGTRIADGTSPKASKPGSKNMKEATSGFTDDLVKLLQNGRG